MDHDTIVIIFAVVIGIAVVGWLIYGLLSGGTRDDDERRQSHEEGNQRKN